jgi:hypothetical protein
MDEKIFTNLEMCIYQGVTWGFAKVYNLTSKKFGKDKQKWNKTCVDFVLCPRKFCSLLKRKR